MTTTDPKLIERIARALSLELDRHGDTEAVERQRAEAEWPRYVRHATAILPIVAAAINEAAHQWREVILDALCDWHVLPDEVVNDPAKALALLVKLECQSAVDPAVSEDAAKLRDEAAQKERAGIWARMCSIEPDEELAGCHANWGDFLQILEGELAAASERGAAMDALIADSADMIEAHKESQHG